MTFATFTGVDLTSARLSNADLTHASLEGANLTDADLSGATLIDTNLTGAILVRTVLSETTLDSCGVYGISAWDVQGTPREAKTLTITPSGQSPITVDSLEVAQFTYLMLRSERIRDVLSTIGKKGVLILGRFTERMHVLNQLRDALRERGYVPIVFDFERPTDRDFTETIMTLAGMCAFIIADVTKPRSVPLELQATVPNYMVPFVPVIEKGEEPFAMFVDLWQKHREWVLDPLRYASVERLIDSLDEEVIQPALRRRAVLAARKAETLAIRDLD